MQSYVKQEMSTFYSTLNQVGTNLSTASNLPIADRELYVAGQVTNGNFKNPNAFKFFTWDRRGSQTNQRHGFYLGEPSSQVIDQNWLPAYAEFTGDSPWAMLEDNALEAILSQMKGGANLAVDLAESRATGKLIKSALLITRTVRQLVKDFKRQPWDMPASLWMTYRYGVMPLIYSSYDILDAALKPQATNPIHIRDRQLRRLGEGLISKTGSRTSYTNPEITVKRAFDSARLEYGFMFRPKPNGLYDWTSLNPFGIAWELVPLSFVADWFVNVGQTLSLWEDYVLFNDSFIGGWATYSRKCELTWSMIGTQGNGSPSYWPNGTPMDGTYLAFQRGSASTKKVYRERIVLTALPTPNGLRVRTQLGAKRYADAASLLKLMVFRSK